MSRIPQLSSPRTRTTSTPTAPRATGTLTPSKSRTNLRSPSPLKPPVPNSPTIKTAVARKPGLKSAAPPSREASPPPAKAAISLRDAIAMKRAEAKKAATRGDASGGSDSVPDSPMKAQNGDEDALGRWTVRETIERARSSGVLNIAARDLKCIPSALFEIHLSITPERLALVPDEPPLPEPSEDIIKRRPGHSSPSWYEAQDLEVIKAGNNDILEIQPEISMFGSLKSVDLHINKLTAVPDTLTDLMALTSLDLSHNLLTSLPSNLFALPVLITLNISHNKLTSLPFSAPFSTNTYSGGSAIRAGSSLFAPVIERATKPLPRLQTLDASHNQLTSSSIDHEAGALPVSLVKIDLSQNPLAGDTWEGASLIRAFGTLPELRELLCGQALLSDDAFPADLFAANSSTGVFRALRKLDLEETKVTEGAVRGALEGKTPRTLTFDITTGEVPEGVLQIAVGKKVIKEAWEIEAEMRVKEKLGRRAGAISPQNDAAVGAPAIPKEIVKEPWELEAEQGLTGAGAQRRARAASAARTTSSPGDTEPKPKAAAELRKEAWEIDAEQGLLTEGARRRARAAAASAEAQKKAAASVLPSKPDAEQASASGSASSPGAVLSNSKYYNATHRTLTLPPSTAPARNAAGHARNFSSFSPARATAVNAAELALPTASLPLALICKQDFARTLRVLNLNDRRMDPSFVLPALSEGEGALLPALEELSLEGCRLADAVPVARGEGAARASEPLLPLLVRLFPSLRTLDLSCNGLTSAALGTEALAALLLADETTGRRGLRHLRLRENRLENLDGLVQIAERFKGHRTVPEWNVEELDVRDNAIGRLPPELGLLPLDVFLVGGNTFRVPPARVWDREGTKGLLSWLRGRVE